MRRLFVFLAVMSATGCGLLPGYKLKEARACVPVIRDYALHALETPGALKLVPANRREVIEQTDPTITRASYAAYHFTWHDQEHHPLAKVETSAPPQCEAFSVEFPVDPALLKAEPERNVAKLVAAGYSLSAPLTIAGIEADELKRLREFHVTPGARTDIPDVPFGFSHNRWEEFKAKVTAGDEIRELASPPESWGRLAGWRGYVLIRNGVIVAEMMTMMN